MLNVFLVQKSIRNNQRGLYCCLCKRWLHLSCTSFTIKEYQSLLPTSEVRYCHICLASIFQFDNTSDNLEYMNCIFNLGYSRTSSSNYIFSTCQLSLVSKMLGTDHNIDPDYNCIRQNCISSTLSLMILLTKIAYLMFTSQFCI